ncbi:MAG: leucine-rich repeat protein, partial [Eubacterium sp.]|nr:leucine-rich repeat protein [Eubacterium sp.]
APFTFKDCRNLKKIIAGPSLKNVYGYAFGGCDSLTEFFFAPGTKLSPMAFKNKGQGK